ncbi:cupin domain-containing protein [Streptomyces sp. enrichment culture]|uniref:cupin domain-containing protein n=1 Tax=Streptomyces sp. enrichment culture TaxID=1795815 RepID=UPI003F5525E3
MHKPVVAPAHQAEVVPLAHGGAFHLLLDGEGALGANRLTLPAGTDGAAPHRHTRASELFYLLTGRLEFLLGDQTLMATEGDLIVVPPNLVHAFGTPPDTPADVLVVMTPAVKRFDYFRLLSQVSLGQEPPEKLLAAQTRFDVHFTADATWTRRRRTP